MSVQPWAGRGDWPLRVDAPFPHECQSENGMMIILDRAGLDDDLCDATVVMLHGLDRERQTAVCIMPHGHDGPHMPQSPGSVADHGRLIVRSIGRRPSDAEVLR